MGQVPGEGRDSTWRMEKKGGKNQCQAVIELVT